MGSWGSLSSSMSPGGVSGEKDTWRDIFSVNIHFLSLKVPPALGPMSAYPHRTTSLLLSTDLVLGSCGWWEVTAWV